MGEYVNPLWNNFAPQHRVENLLLVEQNKVNYRDIRGKPYVTVSAKGIANGLSDIPNNGADFGPDTPNTQTSGIQEAINYAWEKYSSVYTNSGGPLIKLGEGTFQINADIIPPTSGTSANIGMLQIVGNGNEATYIQPGQGVNCFNLSNIQSTNVIFRDFSFRNQFTLSGNPNGTSPSSFVKSIFTDIYGPFYTFENVTFRIIGSGVSITDAAVYTYNVQYITFDNCVFDVGSGDMFNISNNVDVVIMNNCLFGSGASGTINSPTILVTNALQGTLNFTVEDASFVYISGFIAEGPTIAGVVNIMICEAFFNAYGQPLSIATGAILNYLDISHSKITIQSSAITEFIANLANASLDYINTNGTIINFASGVTPFALPAANVATTTPSVPASGTAQQNTNPYAVKVYVNGGAITEIQITIGSTSYTVYSNSTASAVYEGFTLPAGASITLTYTTAPTWSWVPE